MRTEFGDECLNESSRCDLLCSVVFTLLQNAQIFNTKTEHWVILSACVTLCVSLTRQLHRSAFRYSRLVYNNPAVLWNHALHLTYQIYPENGFLQFLRPSTKPLPLIRTYLQLSLLDLKRETYAQKQLCSYSIIVAGR